MYLNPAGFIPCRKTFVVFTADLQAFYDQGNQRAATGLQRTNPGEMADRDRGRNRIEVERFLLEKVDSVPHLEALLLLWSTGGKRWSGAELGARLYIDANAARAILEDLTRLQLIDGSGDDYWYEPGTPARDELMQAVNDVYRAEMVRVANLIHSKASRAVREFARAFRFREDG